MVDTKNTWWGMRHAAHHLTGQSLIEAEPEMHEAGEARREKISHHLGCQAAWDGVGARTWDGHWEERLEQNNGREIHEIRSELT